MAAMNFRRQHHDTLLIPFMMTAHTMLIHLLVLILPQSFVTTAFNPLSPTNLRRLAEASSLSYLSFDKIPTSPYYSSCQLEPLLQVVDPASESGATIFLDKSTSSSPPASLSSSPSRQKIIVACRGSANPKNFGTNLKFNLVPATKLSLSPNKLPPDATIHEGFQDASLGLWKVLCPRLINVLNNRNQLTSTGNKIENVEVIFTGHSLGAATALLCSVHYNSYFRRRNNVDATTIAKQEDATTKATTSSYPTPTIVTFGGPKLCNTILARYLRTYALEGSQILHLVHDRDPILANNQKLWDSLGFENVGVEMQCDPYQVAVLDASLDGTKIIMEKKRTFFGRFVWNIVDHCNYMGVFIGPRVLLS
ncbi:hypothetical protein ACHAXS_002839 [Conticribra weissflogii]